MGTWQIIWFILVGVLLIGYTILDGFDLGVGFWHLFTTGEKERQSLLESIRPFWDGNEVWLLAGGGALFAAFPPVYATVFSGFYLAFLLVLFGLIIRVIGIDFRDKVDSPTWKQFFDYVFAIGSIIPSLLFGVALGNVIRGLPLSQQGDFVGTFFDLLNPYSLLCGVTGLFLLATHGGLYLMLKTENGLRQKIKSWVTISWKIFLALFLIVTLWSLIAIQRDGQWFSTAVSLLSLTAIGGIYFFHAKGKSVQAFTCSCLNIVFIFIAVAGALFPFMVRSINNPELGLTIYNSSSSELTLKIMFLLTLIGMPLVGVYTFYIYRVFRKSI